MARREGASTRSARRRLVAGGLIGVVLLAAGGWLAARQIRSPAQVAADTAPPQRSAITVPVARRTLATEVIVRGTVRYGAPQPVVLATSSLKSGSEIITRAPRRTGRLGEGSVALTVSGRPVFVLRGAEPAHRDLGPGVDGTDVRQLEQALARLGFSPGPVDGRYDGATAAAVADWYRKKGWTPFGPTDLQQEQLRSAQGAAAQAKDAMLQTRLALETAARGATPADVNQARSDLNAARGGVHTAVLDGATAAAKEGAARDKLAAAPAADQLARANLRRDLAAARAEAAAKRTDVNAAVDRLAEARRRLQQAPPDTPPADRSALEADVRRAEDALTSASAALDSAAAAVDSARAAGNDAIARALADRRQATRDVRLAHAELVRARLALQTARAQERLAATRIRILTTAPDTRTERQIAMAAAQEANRTHAEVLRVAGAAGVQVPADELLFFATLPLRVDSVKAKRGDSLGGRVMTVTNSRLAIDSSLSLGDAKLVKAGAPVLIEEPDLGVKVRGTVTQVADKPGTNRVDPTRVYFEVTPASAPASIVGASVKLTIAVDTTRGPVLAVPVSALSVGADGSSRLQVERAAGRVDFVSVTPGLAAKGLVEVRPIRGALAPGDLVIVGRDAGGPAPAGPGGGGGGR